MKCCPTKKGMDLQVISGTFRAIYVLGIFANIRERITFIPLFCETFIAFFMDLSVKFPSIYLPRYIDRIAELESRQPSDLLHVSSSQLDEERRHTMEVQRQLQESQRLVFDLQRELQDVQRQVFELQKQVHEKEKSLREMQDKVVYPIKIEPEKTQFKTSDFCPSFDASWF